MDGDETDFEKINQSLQHLRDEELLALEKLVWNKAVHMLSDPIYKHMRFSARAEYRSEIGSEESLSFDTIQERLENLNPAEIQALHQLILWHRDKTHVHEGQHVSTSWGTTHPMGGISFNVGISGMPSEQMVDFLNPESDALKQFRELTNLMSQANEAKKAGDNETALSLIDEIIRESAEMGVPNYLLDQLRADFL